MKLFGILVLVVGGGLLAIALGTGEPDYVPPAPLETPEAIPATLVGSAPAGFELRTLEVSGMCCGGCAGKLHAALVAVEGVQGAAVDPVLGRAEAFVAAEVEPGVLARALTFGDYLATPLD